MKQVVDVIVRRAWLGNRCEGSGRVSLGIGGEGTSGIGARHFIRTFRLFKEGRSQGWMTRVRMRAVVLNREGRRRLV